MKHSMPSYSKTNTSVGHVKQQTHGLGGGRAKGVMVDKRGTASGEHGSKLGWGPINPKAGK